MRLFTRRHTNQDGFAHHFILPILAILAVAGIGTYLLNISRAATTTYKGACTGSTYSSSTNNSSGFARSCIGQAQDLMDALEHQQIATGHTYRTAVARGPGVFAYGRYYYITMNASYDGATVTAIRRLNGSSSLNPATWQYLCNGAYHYGLALNKGAGANRLVFNSRVAGEFTNSPMYRIFTDVCGTPPHSGSSGSTGSSAGSTGTGFISSNGMKLMQNGKQYKSISFDFSPLGDCWDTNWSTSQMDTFFASIPRDSLARFFAPPDSSDSPAFVESIVKEADKYNDHLIVALADADVDNNCDTENASNNGKTAAYYTSAPQAGSTWYNWVQSVVKPLANNPGVAIWEISNEPVHAGVNLYDGQLSQSAFNTYVKNGAADIRAAEVAGAGSAKQLISIAPADMGDIDGGNENNAKTVFSYVNVVDDHDYSFDANPGSPVINPDFATEQQVAKALNKPFMVDEAGVEAGSCSSSALYNSWDNGSQGTTLSNRVTLLVTNKSTDYFRNGASAIDFWLYTGTGGGCSYENINPSDPIMAAVRSYRIP